jgi:hypothetical protein
VVVAADNRDWPILADRPIVNWSGRVRGREGNGAGGGYTIFENNVDIFSFLGVIP